MSPPALDPRIGGSELAATAGLPMLPRHAKTPAAVLTDGPTVPSSVQSDAFDARASFVRLRKGPLVRIPIPSPDQSSWHDFERTAESRTECRYSIASTDDDARSLGGSHAVPAH